MKPAFSSIYSRCVNSVTWRWKIFVSFYKHCAGFWVLSFVLQEQHVISHRPLLVSNEIRTPSLHLFRFDSRSSNHHPHAKSRCEQFVERAKCERVMTIRAKFHFKWVCTLSVTARSLRIWASDPSIETGSDPALPAQLCWWSSTAWSNYGPAGRMRPAAEFLRPAIVLSVVCCVYITVGRQF